MVSLFASVPEAEGQDREDCLWIEATIASFFSVALASVSSSADIPGVEVAAGLVVKVEETVPITAEGETDTFSSATWTESEGERVASMLEDYWEGEGGSEEEAGMKKGESGEEEGAGRKDGKCTPQRGQEVVAMAKVSARMSWSCLLPR